MIIYPLGFGLLDWFVVSALVPVVFDISGLFLLGEGEQNVADKAHWTCRSLDVEQKMLLIHD